MPRTNLGKSRQPIDDDDDLKKVARRNRHKRTQRLEECMNIVAMVFIVGVPSAGGILYLGLIVHEWTTGDYTSLASRATEMLAATGGYIAAHIKRHVESEKEE